MQVELTHARVKQMARRFHAALKQTPRPNYQQTLDILAQMHGYEAYGAMKAAMAAAEQAAAGPARVDLTRAEIARMSDQEIADLSYREGNGEIEVVLQDLDRTRDLIPVWEACDILGGRLEDPYDIEKNGFAGRNERSDATLLSDIALNGRLAELVGDADTAGVTPAPARDHAFEIRHPIDDFAWPVRARGVESALFGFARTTREVLAGHARLEAAVWHLRDGRVSAPDWLDGGLDYLEPEDLAEDMGVDPSPAEAPRVTGEIEAFAWDAGAADGVLLVTQDLILVLEENVHDTLRRGGRILQVLEGPRPSVSDAKAGERRLQAWLERFGWVL